MRICVLALSLRAAGGRTVGQGIINSLSRIGPQHHYSLMVPSDVGYEALCGALPHAETYVHRQRGGRVGRLIFERRELPRMVRKAKPDVILSLDMRGLLEPPCPQAVFPQDAHLFYPTRHYGREALRVRAVKAYDKRYLRRLLPRVSLLLCQTPVVEKRIRDKYGYTGPAFVCGSAVSGCLTSYAENPPVPEKLKGLAGRFRLLSLGRYYAHKNLESLVELYQRYSRELADVAVILTIAADQHPNAGRFLDSVRRAGLADRIVNVGPVAHEHVGAYYRHSDAMLMPTLLETFGLPYIEAMHMGLPIVTSNMDFSRYVCGDAAEFFDPWSSESMLGAIQRIKTDGGRRAELIAKGRQRLTTNGTSWETITQQILERLEMMRA